MAEVPAPVLERPNTPSATENFGAQDTFLLQERSTSKGDQMLIQDASGAQRWISKPEPPQTPTAEVAEAVTSPTEREALPSRRYSSLSEPNLQGEFVREMNYYGRDVIVIIDDNGDEQIILDPKEIQGLESGVLEPKEGAKPIDYDRPAFERQGKTVDYYQGGQPVPQSQILAEERSRIIGERIKNLAQQNPEAVAQAVATWVNGAPDKVSGLQPVDQRTSNIGVVQALVDRLGQGFQTAQVESAQPINQEVQTLADNFYKNERVIDSSYPENSYTQRLNGFVNSTGSDLTTDAKVGMFNDLLTFSNRSIDQRANDEKYPMVTTELSQHPSNGVLFNGIWNEVRRQHPDLPPETINAQATYLYRFAKDERFHYWGDDPDQTVQQILGHKEALVKLGNHVSDILLVQGPKLGENLAFKTTTKSPATTEPKTQAEPLSEDDRRRQIIHQRMKDLAIQNPGLVGRLMQRWLGQESPIEQAHAAQIPTRKSEVDQAKAALGRTTSGIDPLGQSVDITLDDDSDLDLEEEATTFTPMDPTDMGRNL